jgi:hypothetical protein
MRVSPVCNQSTILASLYIKLRYDTLKRNLACWHSYSEKINGLVFGLFSRVVQILECNAVDSVVNKHLE